MKVVCAWCEQAGRVVLLGGKEDGNGAVSHGICAEHLDALRTRAERKKARASALDRVASQVSKA